MEQVQPSVPTLIVTAATTIEIGAPQIPIGGTAVGGGAQTDDGFTNQPLVWGGAPWPFFGVPRASINVGSNGNVTFGAGDSSGGQDENVMLTGPARIAPAWCNLYPPAGGNVRSSQTPDTYTVSWTSVPESYFAPNGNNFSIQLYQGVGNTPSGVFTIYYGSTTMFAALTGISPGGLPALPPNATATNVNWSVTAGSNGGRGAIPAGTAKIQSFGWGFDLFDLMTIGGAPRITFVPDGAGGYTYFVGTR
jgi:hypothetical protein